MIEIHSMPTEPLWCFCGIKEMTSASRVCVIIQFCWWHNDVPLILAVYYFHMERRQDYRFNPSPHISVYRRNALSSLCNTGNQIPISPEPSSSQSLHRDIQSSFSRPVWDTWIRFDLPRPFWLSIQCIRATLQRFTSFTLCSSIF